MPVGFGNINLHFAAAWHLKYMLSMLSLAALHFILKNVALQGGFS